jgi:hypothetical protein
VGLTQVIGRIVEVIRIAHRLPSITRQAGTSTGMHAW